MSGNPQDQLALRGEANSSTHHAEWQAFINDVGKLPETDGGAGSHCWAGRTSKQKLFCKWILLKGNTQELDMTLKRESSNISRGTSLSETKSATEIIVPIAKLQFTYGLQFFGV